MTPLLTVAIPAHNRPEDLRALFDTILAQAPGDFDVLVVEDCSPRQAETREVVERAAGRAAPPAPTPRVQASVPHAPRSGERVRVRSRTSLLAPPTAFG